tara:strand:- start:199 stop:897 length:699 start_codon:yes stop_codon:yes gene_type:complete
MTQFSQDNVTLNPGVSGANVATDYVSSKDAHYQIVKLDFGAEDNSSLATLANPFPTNIVGINSSWQTLPVAGNTEGGAILITGTFGFTGSISGNDFNVGITSIEGGLTFAITNHSVGGITIPIDVSGSSITIGNVSLPSSMTFGSFTMDTTHTITLAGFSCSTGIKVKNFAGFTDSGAIVGIGNSIAAGVTTPGFLLMAGEEVFIEVDDIDRLTFNCSPESNNKATVTYQAS